MRKKCTKCRKCKNFGKILLRFWKYFAKSYHFYAGFGLFKACTIKNGQLGAKVLKGGMGGGSDEVVQKAQVCGYFFFKAFPVKVVAIFAFHLYMK